MPIDVSQHLVLKNEKTFSTWNTFHTYFERFRRRNISKRGKHFTRIKSVAKSNSTVLCVSWEIVEFIEVNCSIEQKTQAARFSRT